MVIFGVGFGGLELATRLSEELADEVQVTLIDQSDAFAVGFAKLDEMRHVYRDIAKPSVELRQETVVSID